MEINKLKDDIEFAENVIYGAKFASCCYFNDSSMVYRATNENLNNSYYQEIISNKKRALSVIASGDQIINLILLGSKDITGYDISRFPKYYLALKLAALKKLTREEYIRYIVGDSEEYSLNRNLYSKFNQELSADFRIFWDNIFNKFTESQIFRSSLFGYYQVSEKIMVANNPYLCSNNYYELQNRINEVELKLIDLNIFDLNSKMFDPFDLIILSNIIDYLKDFFIDNRVYAKYKRFLKTLPLAKNGIILSYSFGNDVNLKKYFRGRNFKIVEIDQNSEDGEIKRNDKIITYQKVKKLSLF